ncbi:MAG: DNA repair ATPase [Pirellulales bacterium]
MPDPNDTPEVAEQLEGGTYEIIRSRLREHGKMLRTRLDQLNEARRAVFGSIKTTLLSTERITTANNCTPRDIYAVGDHFIFGYNVHIGLRSEISIDDVFSVFTFHEGALQEQSLDLLGDGQFQRDFKEIYRYYKNAEFAKFFIREGYLYMVFRVGKAVADIKAFKWLVQEGKLKYLDNRSDHEVRFPDRHAFTWKRATLDQHLYGAHPHISIEDRVFVETVGGDLTIKIEDNTESGEGIYQEPVENPDQTLDDAEIQYAVLENIILLKIRPYQEKSFRYLVYNEKLQQVKRIDSIADACVLLPSGHGLIFPNGYYLQSGETKTFDNELSDLLFETSVAASNGEDVLYRFYNRQSGVYVLLHYNVIEQRVDTPLICHGATLFSNGELICFTAQEETAQKHHALQIWQTPYVEGDLVPDADPDSLLFKVGNRDLVRAMAECHETLNLLEKEDAYANLYVDIVKNTTNVMDSYFWLDHDETFHLNQPLFEIKAAATAAIDEFDKVVRVKRNTAEAFARVKSSKDSLLNQIKRQRFEVIDDFVDSLSKLQRLRGEVVSLADLRYAGEARVEGLGIEVAEQVDQLAKRCVAFLLRKDSLAPYQTRVDAQREKIGSLQKVTEAKDLAKQIDASAAEMEMLIEIVSNLKIEDTTQRTTIIENISTIFSTLNGARSALKGKLKSLLSVEGVAEFNSQLKLLNQSVVNWLDVCDSPQKCDEFLTRLMVQIEELEGRFAEFDEFVLQLTEKREEVYHVFEQRKLALVEARNKRATSLASAAERILKGISTRVGTLTSVEEIHGYFAADLMVDKVRDIVEQLTQLEDSVKVDDIQSRLKTVREDAVRQLKDRQELFVDGEQVIQLGQRKFSVNVQALDLTTVTRDEQIELHLTGTNFYQPLVDHDLENARDLWSQEVLSESTHVYRGEYLAYQLYKQVVNGDNEISPADLLKQTAAETVKFVQQQMGPRYREAYTKGVHDCDAAILLRPLLEMRSTIGLLRFSAPARAMANLYWHEFTTAELKKLLGAKLAGFGSVGEVFPASQSQAQYLADLEALLAQFIVEGGLFAEVLVSDAAAYLFAELTQPGSFALSRRAVDLYQSMQEHLKKTGQRERMAKSLDSVRCDARSRHLLARDWAKAFVHYSQATDSKHPDDADYVDELAILLANQQLDHSSIVDGNTHRELTGLVGQHPRIDSGSYHLNFNRFMCRLRQYDAEIVPRFTNYLDRKQELVEEARKTLRLEEFRPRVLTSFVRNRLIDEVYLPLVGDNLAKQIGVVGEEKRTDLMGLLLLVSPPGYGKTTLMEYIANRLGLIFMKINGPTIGHGVTSLDPLEAPNAAAREEVEKLNLALEMGDNVMLYLDDIQHCHPELLQKFISLCDAQRKIEGVYQGQTRTYDLRGKKVVVVMAGNPYTESGEKFKIPDMLANRADIYNLGEIIGDTADAFEMSYLENSLTSNPTLSKLAAHSQKDVHGVIKIASTGDQEGIELEGAYAAEDLREMISVMQKLLRVRDVILAVNREYIRSAAMADAYRTEPPFKLQGSYRNMNRIAGKVVPIMNDGELETLILSNYQNDSQTLTSDNEANMLKFKELLGILTADETQRWEEIKVAFARNNRLQGAGTDDRFGQAVVELSAFSEGLEAIRRTLIDGISQMHTTSERQRKEIVSAVASSDVAPKPIIVQHKVPRVVLGVVKSQFQLMQNWLGPMLSAENEQTGQMRLLRQSVEKCLQEYGNLIDELEASKSAEAKKDSTGKSK